MTPGPRVVCDIQATQSLQHGSRGIARYAGEHAAAMLRVAPEAMAGLLLNPRFTLPPSAERFLSSGLLRWRDRTDPLLREGPLLFHVMSPFELGVPLEELWPAAVRRPEVRLAVTLYDLIPLIYPERYLEDPATRQRYMARLQMLRAADVVVAISECSRADAIRLLGIHPDRVHVIHAGVSDRFRPSARSHEVLMERLRGVLPDLRDGFFLYTGGVDFRKNMEELILSHAALPREVRAAHQLVIVCSMPPEARRHYAHVAREAGGEDDILLTGFVTDDALRGLYQATRMFVFPSVYEGFGLPIVEAVACGAPVIASSRSSLPEVTPCAEALFDPDEPGALTAMMLRAARDDAFVERLHAASVAAHGAFTWDRTAERTIEAFERRWHARPARRRHRPRMAIVSPYPPALSGIAHYTRQLMEALGGRAHVDCFVDGDPADHAPAPPGCAVHDVARLERMAELQGYDAVLHCMGNNPLHDFVMDAAARVPGAILCHDLRLVRYHFRPGGPRRLVDALREMYGVRLPPSLDRDDVGFEEIEAAGLWMLAGVIDRADRVLVHSRYGAEVVRLEGEAIGRTPSVEVVPFGYPRPDPAASGRRLSRPPTKPLVASFGLVDPVKRPDALIEALPALRDRHPGTTLALVGPVAPRYARELRRRARAAGVGDAFVVTGAVGDDAYRRWMRLADAAVQLRAYSQGEASLTVAETLAAGVPTVVTAVGWMGEIPPRVVTGLPVDATPAEIAAAVGDLIADRDMWAARRDAGLRWTRANGFDRVADALLDALIPARAAAS